MEINKFINKIIQGDSLRVLKQMPDESVNCMMTSPPYWALRDYGNAVESIWDGDKSCEHKFQIEEKKNPMDRGGNLGSFTEKRPKDWVQMQGNTIKMGFCQKCGAWKGQLGLEPTLDLYIKHLCDIFNEIKRVLRKDGTCWVNLGDTYASTPSGLTNKKAEEWNKKGDGLFSRLYRRNTNDMTSETTWKPTKYEGLIEKSLSLIPFRFVIEMVNRGWIVRNTIIWHKPNCMPSSVKDRFTVDFEYLFFFVKNKKYYFETQYEPLAESSMKDKRKDKGLVLHKSGKAIMPENPSGMKGCSINSNGRNKRAVWSICPQPFKEKHFATYPEELCETPIKAGCPEFVCNKCGKAREKIIEREGLSSADYMRDKDKSNFKSEQGQKQNIRAPREVFERKIIEKGLTNCNCNAGFSGGIVLDPFFGAGTTGLVALKQNKQFIGIELNPEYIKIAEERLKPYLQQTKIDGFNGA